jgi:single-stranded-DNA-specific exonuclease
MARWVLNKSFDKNIANSLNESLGTPKIIGELLAKRGVSDFDSAKAFFRPNADQFHEPSLMKDLDKAVDRLEIAKVENEGVLVYGDYDVDGTCSVALVESCLNEYGFQTEAYQPDRFTEGYGLSQKGLAYAKEKKCSLLIALDCGINAVELIAEAQESGIDVIVCDHHLPKDVLPPAHAILNPKQHDCNYPYKELCGCGIGFKLMIALEQKLLGTHAFALSKLDMVALATAADIVSLSGENRAIVYLGLIQLNQKPSVGIASLIKSSGKARELSCRDMIFQLAPRINAAGRLYHAKFAIDILLGIENTDALSQDLNKINTERQELGQAVFDSALEQASNNPYKFSQVVYSADWNKGVIGIVASRLIEKHYKPCLVISSLGDGLASGSARTIEGVNVHQALSTCEDLFASFGGHAAAAGFKIEFDKIPELQKRFDAACAEQLNNTIPEECIMADSLLNIADINTKVYRICEQFEPTGPDNLRPKFICEDAVVMEKRIIGKDNNHLKLKVSSIHDTGTEYDAPLWNMADKVDEYPEVGEPIKLVYALEWNEFMGKGKIQLRVYDAKV